MSTNEPHGVATRSSEPGPDSSDLLLSQTARDPLGHRLGPAATFATTEHFNLQTARALTVSEANGRVLLPVLAFVGVVTFVRLVQSSIEDLAYAHRIALLRSFYLRVSPDLAPYLVVVEGTRATTPFGGELGPSAWQLTLTAAGMVAVVNSVVVAACAGLPLDATGVHGLAIPLAVGAVI